MLVILFLAGIVFVYRVKIVIPPFAFAAIIAYIAHPLVNVFEQKKMPRPAAILIVYLIFATIIGILVSFLVPQLVAEIDDILMILPKQTEKIEEFGQDALKGLRRIKIPESLNEGVTLVIRRIELLLENLATRVAQLLLGLVSHLFSLAIAPFLAFYVLRDSEALRERFSLYIPIGYQTEVSQLINEFNKILNAFIRGQLFVSMIVGGLIAAGLALVGIRYALFIGIFAGLFNIIPYFGPIIGIIPALALAVLKSPMAILWVIVIFIVVNQIEANVIGPKIIGERVGLHPLAVIFAILAGGELLGIVGMLLAVPFAAMIRVLLMHFLVLPRHRP